MCVCACFAEEEEEGEEEEAGKGVMESKFGLISRSCQISLEEKEGKEGGRQSHPSCGNVR